MPARDSSEIKEKILFVLRKRGPSLPVHIATELEISPLFASAFLAELVSEKKIKISNMKVGNSPLYLIAGQEPMLERFSQHLKSKEKDAFALLKEEKFLKDDGQHPAIRVALRSIRDFAVPFKARDEIFWRYFTVPETEFKIKPQLKKIEKKKVKELDIFDKEKAEEKPKRKTTRKRKSIKKNDKFFNKVKEFLSEKSIEIIDIESFNKNELVLRVKSQDKEKLLVVYNKKRINENDILKANKKSSELGLSYMLLSFGEPLKKLTNLIQALSNLSTIETLK